MNLRFHIALAVGCMLGIAVGLHAQQQQQQRPPATQQPAQKPAESNPFPEDTSNVPVVPTSGEPAPALPASPAASSATTSLLKNDNDPVHSPDDPVPDDSEQTGFSSSLAGTNDVNIPDDVKPGKHRRSDKPTEAVHQETAKEDEEVAEFELSRKNWKAALSRYQSALVTDPENPDVYWGIAESQRQLGEFANARANYTKVVEYDPDSKHAKDARKWLKDPQIANAPAVSKNRPH